MTTGLDVETKKQMAPMELGVTGEFEHDRNDMWRERESQPVLSLAVHRGCSVVDWFDGYHRKRSEETRQDETRQ